VKLVSKLRKPHGKIDQINNCLTPIHQRAKLMQESSWRNMSLFYCPER